MSEGYVLYDILSEKSKGISNDSNWNKLASSLCSLDKKNAEIVFSLIYHHWIINKMKSPGLPFSAVTISGKKGVQFKMNNIPIDLKKILLIYMLIVES